jgi:hypothetical protein
MGWLGERWSAFKDGVGPGRVGLVASVSAIAAGLVNIANVVHEPELLPVPIPWIVAFAFVCLSVAWSMIEYTVGLRRQLKGAVDLEEALDKLSEYFDEGNNQIFNARVTSQSDYGGWRVLWQQWYKKVEDHLQSKLGLRERNLFRNIVLFQSVAIPQAFDPSHRHDLNVLYRQLETIRDIVVRHSERADQWRVHGLELRS